MAKRKTQLNSFRTWLFDRGLERQTVYNYVSRVRAILDSTSSLDLFQIQTSMTQLSSSTRPKSSFRTPWRHYVDYMSVMEQTKVPMPPSSSGYTKIIYPRAVQDAVQTLVQNHYYTPKLIPQCRWEHFTPDNVQGKWTMSHPDHPGERWYPPLDLIMILFEWSSSTQPQPHTPLVAVRQDSSVPLASHALGKMIRG